MFKGFDFECTLSNGYYFMLYNDVSEDLKIPYEEEYGKPILYKNGIGQFTNKLRLIRKLMINLNLSSI